jgi:hypothetical protein
MDIEPIVRFWHNSGDDLLDFLGIDRSLLGTVEDTRRRFLRAIPTGDPDRQSIAFAINVNGQIHSRDQLLALAHHRSGSAGVGLVDSLVSAPYQGLFRFGANRTPDASDAHTEHRREPDARPVPETRYIERPDGVALPGEFHLRYVFRKDIPGLFETANRRAMPT